MGRQLDTESEVLNVTGALESAEVVLNNGEQYQNCEGYTVFMSLDVQAPSAGAFTAAASDVCTKTGHGFQTGLKGAASTDGVLPGGLSATDYYVIKIDANTFKLAASYADSLAGVAMDITDAGTGTHTFTPAALSGATWKIQVSPDVEGSSWFDLATATSITVDANSITEKVAPKYKRIKTVFAAAAGQVIATQKIVVDRNVRT